MKKLLIIALILILILIGAVFYLASNAQQLAEKYKPEIEKTASKALDAQVTLGELSVSIFPTIRVGVDALSVKRDGNAKGLTLNNITLDVDTFALLGGTFVIDEFSISEPYITLIKENGVTWIEGLPRGKKTEQPAAKTGPAPVETEGKKAVAVSSALSFALNSFAINDAKITFDDRDAKKLHEITDINLNSSVKLSESVIALPDTQLSLQALHSIPLKIAAKNISFDTNSNTLTIPENSIQIFGNSILQTAKLDLTNTKGNASITIQELNLADFVPTIRQLVPAMAAISLQGALSKNIEVGIQSASALVLDGSISLQKITVKKDTLSFADLSGPIKIAVKKTGPKTNASIISQKLAANLNGAPAVIDFDLSASSETARVNDFTFRAFDGALNTKATANLTEPKDFQATVAIRDIHLGKLIAAGIPSVPNSIEGTLENLDTTVSGAQSGNMKQSIKGTGDVLIRDGRIKGVNIAGSTLQALKLPFLEQELYKMVPEEFAEFLNDDDTQLKELSARWTIRNQQLLLESLRIVSTFYEVTGKGTISFAQQLDLKTSLVFSKEFSEKFAGKTKEARYLLDENGQLVIPLAISGTPPKVLLLPDAEYLIKLQAGQALKREAGKALDKVLGDKGGKASRAIKDIFGF